MTEPTSKPRKPVIQKAPDLTRLAREGETITVRNLLNTITVLVIKVAGNEEISEFAAHGDPNGGDFMELPSTYLKNPQFRKSMQQEIYDIVDADDPEVIGAVVAQRASWKAAQSMRDEAERMVQSQAPRAFSGTQCLAQDGRSQCAEFAISSKTSERAPLCTRHSHLAHQYAPEETGKFIDGKPEVAWHRVKLFG